MNSPVMPHRRIVIFVARQCHQIRARGLEEIKRKLKRLYQLGTRFFLFWLLLPVTLPAVVIMRMIRPLVVIRIYRIISWRIGHFAGNIELYMCERDAGINIPQGRFIDFWYYPCAPCNSQLARMWQRTIHIGPRWLLASMARINAYIPGGNTHSIGNNSAGDMDVHNLTDRFPSHLSFLPDEEKQGEAGLRALGVPENAQFVCLIARDSSYLTNQSSHLDWTRHDYRDCNIQNYVLAAQKLTERGYYVIRMGAVVKETMHVNNPMIIDYASNNMRSDFMDIYLGAKCAFCISGNSGFEAVPYIFRRPMVYVDYVPLGLMRTDSERLIATTKKHWLKKQQRHMTFKEILEHVGYSDPSSDYNKLGVELIESEPEEIAAVVLEMEERLKGTWQDTDEAETLQKKFWKNFPKASYHGELRSRMGTDYLSRHKDLLA